MTILPCNVLFKVQHENRYFSITCDGVLNTTKFNSLLVPGKIKDLCKIAYYSNSLPYVSVDAFDLFMNLILTPDNVKIYNPKNLAAFDLEPIIKVLTYANDENDVIIVGALLARLENNDEGFRSAYEKLNNIKKENNIPTPTLIPTLSEVIIVVTICAIIAIIAMIVI